MFDTTTSDCTNVSTHDGAAGRVTDRLRCPTPVKMVAAVVLLLAVVNFVYAFYFLSNNVLASLAFCKGLFGIAAALGLLNLRNGWRLLVIITTGLSVFVLPFYFLAIVLSSDISRFVSELSGIESRTGIAFAIAIGFAVCLWICRTLLRSDVERAFSSARSEYPAA